MFVWMLLAVLGLPGCFYIGNDLHERELDGDGDQVPWPEDCDPDDPLASVRQGWFADADGDGFGDPGVQIEACGQPIGFVENSGDCDDTRVEVHPQGTEVCDGLGVDEDCDGRVDDEDEAPAGQREFYVDNDADGFGDPGAVVMACEQPANASAIPGDCDDSDASINPDGIEVCGGGDEDCDGVSDDDDASVTGTTSYWTDVDGDGYGDPNERIFRCTPVSGLVEDDTDCDDSAAGVNPGADEVCDPGQVDENCNGLSNEDGQTIPYWADADSDGYGDPAVTVDACAQPSGFVPDDTDCNDAHAGIHPGATEVCDPADVDENCNGLSDDAEGGPLIGPEYFPDADADGFGDAAAVPVVYCDTVPTGLVADGSDCDDLRELINPGATEVCDGIDNDCDGDIDDADADVSGRTEWYLDADSDGFGAGIASFVLACTAPDAQHVADFTDCDDSNAAINPSATELCDGADNDCDGAADDADPQGVSDPSTYYLDNDGDGFGAIPVQACVPPAGAVGDGTDCDDNDILVHPGGVEVCGGGDEDCDGVANDSSAADAGILWLDSDGDGYGDPGLPLSTCAATEPGYVGNSADCDDGSGAINPAATEVCGGGDEDCDGLVDDADDNVSGTLLFYQDADSDGFGGPLSIGACVAPTGFVATNTDCNDGAAAVNPGATEVCDGQDADEDCNGLADDADPGLLASSTAPYYPDLDGDGFGSSLIGGLACEPPAGFAATSTDCDDTDPTSNPARVEFCDVANADNDCDGFADDLDPQGASGQQLYYADVDGDGFGDALDGGAALCDPLAGEELNNLDCDDGDGSRYPGAIEYYGDGVDSDCDGLEDLCGGGTFLVPSAPFPTIDSAVQASCPGDVVKIQPGTYTENLDLTGKELFVDAVDAGNRPVVDGASAGPVFIMDGTSALDDLILQNGSGVDGGCVQVRSGVDVVITDTDFLGCSTAGNGGAVHTDAATTGFACGDCRVVGASAVFDGGAFYGAGALEIDNSQVLSSTAGGSGGALAGGPGGNIYVGDSSFDGSTAGLDGGALACIGCSHFDMVRSTYTNNSALAGNGGAISIDSPVGNHGSLVESDFIGNTAAGDGGAVYYRNLLGWDSDPRSILFDSNSAGGRGGGIYLESAYNTDLDDTTFLGNQAVEGAAIYADDVVMDWDRTRVDGNIATGWGAVSVLNSTTDFRAIDQMTLVNNIGPGPALFLDRGGRMISMRIDASNPLSGGNIDVRGDHDLFNILTWGDSIGPSVYFQGAAGESASLTNATLADGPATRGLSLELTGSSLVLSNVAITGNSVGIDKPILADADPVMEYCNVFGNTTDFSGTPAPGGTNIAVPPGYVGAGSYRLGTGSQMIDAGDVGILDPDNSRSDIGNYGGPFAQ